MPATDLTEVTDGDSGDTQIRVREACATDLPRLLDIENRVFPGDRLNRRAFRYLLCRANAINLVACVDATVAGYVTVLLRKNSRGARVYSLAVDPLWQGRRIGTRLLAAAESQARSAGCSFIRLEVRADNDRAIRQYVRAGYRQVGMKPGYYEDGEAALHFHKELAAAHGAGTD